MAAALGVFAAVTTGTTTERALAVAPPTAANCATPTTISRNSGPVAADPWTATTPSPITSTITVAPADVPAGALVRDVDVRTFITSWASGDVQVTIAHGGKTVKLVGPAASRRSWDGANDLWNGTVWDDQAAQPVAIGTFSDGAVATVAPDGKLAAFNGMSPAGTWTVTVTDNRLTEPADGETPVDPQDGGTFSGWGLAVQASPDSAQPGATLRSFGSTGGPVDIPDPAVGAEPGPVVDQTINVSVPAGETVRSLDVSTNISHNRQSDLAVSLVSPGGTELVLTPGGGATPDAATLVDWSDTSANPLFGAPDTVNSLQPVMAFSRLIGSNPNGAWKVRVRDRFNRDTGTFISATLKLRTSAGCAVTPPPGGGTTTPPPATGGGITTPPPGGGTTTPPPATGGGTTTSTPTISVRLVGPKMFAVKKGGVVRTRVRLSSKGRIVVQLRKGTKIVKRATIAGRAGTNVVSLKVVRTPGTYQLQIIVTGANGATGRLNGTVRITAR